MVESRDDGLSEQNYSNLCRLCLQNDDFIVDIFHSLDPNPSKKPLPERIFDLYQIKVKKSEGLPTNICHRCLYFTEAFSEFRDNVRKCEAQLQNRVASISILGSVKPHNLNSDADGIKTEESPENICIVIDPNQEYESSDEDFSLDSDDEYPSVQHQISPNQPSQSSQKQIQASASLSETHNDNNTTKNNTEFSQCENDTSSLKNVFLCQYCDMAFLSQIECAEHESRHDAANPHSCNFCPFRSSNRQTVITHIKELHGNERPYVCVQCDKSFIRRADLKKHTTVHTGIRPFSCPVCGKNFSRNTNLTKHLRLHTGEKPYVCQNCPRSFITPEDLRRHEKVHSNKKIFNCSQCPMSFSQKGKLLNHELIHTRKSQMEIGSGKTIKKTSKMQRISEIIEQQQQLLQQHQKLMQQQSRAESTAMSLNLYPNLNLVGNLKSTQQDYVFNKPSMPSYTSDKSFSPESNNLIIDLQQIPQQQPQQTEQKPPEQKRKRELRRNFICSVCQKAFLRRRELQRHSMVHTGIKPFPCQYCPKRFSRKDKATRHEKSHFENKLPCPHCSKIFSEQTLLNAHLKEHETNKVEQTAIAPLTTSSSQPSLPPPQQSLQQTMQIPVGPQRIQPPFGPPIGGFQTSQHQQQQYSMMMMSSQHMQQMPSMYHHHQGFQHYPNYRPPQLNFYNEIQPENSEN